MKTQVSNNHARLSLGNTPHSMEAEAIVALLSDALLAGLDWNGLEPTHCQLGSVHNVAIELLLKLPRRCCCLETNDCNSRISEFLWPDNDTSCDTG
jgi:hypothetical protein